MAVTQKQPNLVEPFIAELRPSPKWTEDSSIVSQPADRNSTFGAKLDIFSGHPLSIITSSI